MIAHDAKRGWESRQLAVSGMALHANPAGARALLQCVPTTLRHSTLGQLAKPGLPEVLAHLGDEATAVLGEALRQIAADGEKTSRLVEKRVVPGVGAREEKFTRDVYTSEFGQPPCEDERAETAKRQAEWDQRHPPPTPPPPSLPGPTPESTPSLAAADDEAQDYAAGSARGIGEDLLTLVSDQFDLLKALHLRGSLAPLGAAMDSRVAIEDFAYTTDKPDSSASVEDVIARLREQFREEARAGIIRACAVFYHGCHGPGRGARSVAPARHAADADCLVAQLDHRLDQAKSVVVRYTLTPDGRCQYEPPLAFSNYPLIFNESGGTYEQYLASRMAEVLRDIMEPDPAKDDAYLAKRIRPLASPGTPLNPGFLRQVLATMSTPQQVTVLDRLTRLSRNEAIPLVIELLDTTPEPGKTRLAGILIRSNTGAG